MYTNFHDSRIRGCTLKFRIVGQWGQCIYYSIILKRPKNSEHITLAISHDLTNVFEYIFFFTASLGCMENNKMTDISETVIATCVVQPGVFSAVLGLLPCSTDFPIIFYNWIDKFWVSSTSGSTLDFWYLSESVMPTHLL